MRPTLPAARGSSQLAATAESLVTDVEGSNRRVTCLLHIISDGTRVRHAQGITSHSSVRSLLVLLLYKQRCLFCLARPVWPVLFGALKAVAVVTRTLRRVIIVERVCVFKTYLYGYENKESFHCRINTETVP